jgi:biopolymer transport protein ExbD
VRRRSREPDELNLAALIDIFSTMLFFLMTTVTFMSLKTLNASVPALSKGDVNTDDGVNVSVRITGEGYVFQASGQPADSSQKELEVTVEIPRTKGLLDSEARWDAKKLTEECWKVKKVAPEVKNVMIFPEPDIPFDAVVLTMDATREMPSIIDPSKRVPLFTRPVLSELIK